MENNINEKLEDSKETTPDLVNAVDDTTSKYIDKLEQQDKKSEKEKKHLKWKILFKNITIVLLLIIIIILLLKSCGSEQKPVVNLEDSEYIEKVDEDISSDTIDFFMNFDSTLTKKNPYYPFGACKENYGRYYTQFTVIENDEIIYQSKMCAPKSETEDYTFSVDLYSILGKGTHNVTIRSQGFSWEDLEPTNVSVYDVVITCK